MSTDPRQRYSVRQLLLDDQLVGAYEPSDLLAHSFTWMLLDLRRRREQGVVLDWTSLRGTIEGDTVAGVHGLTMRLSMLGLPS